MNSDECKLLTERVLAAVFEVSNTLGAGFLLVNFQRLENRIPAGAAPMVYGGVRIERLGWLYHTLLVLRPGESR